MLRFVKIVFWTTLIVLILGVTLLQAVDSPQRQISKIIPDEKLPR